MNDLSIVSDTILSSPDNQHRIVAPKAIRHRIKRAEEIGSVKDVVSVLAVHKWELKDVEKYGSSPRNGYGFLATMFCGGCGAECSLLIIP